MSDPMRIDIDSADKGRRFSATVAGESSPLVTASRDPEHDACRALRARGYSGPVTFYRNGTPSMRIKDAAVTAGKTIEDSHGRLRLAKWRPVQGLASPSGVGKGTRDPEIAAVGESTDVLDPVQ